MFTAEILLRMQSSMMGLKVPRQNTPFALVSGKIIFFPNQLVCLKLLKTANV